VEPEGLKTEIEPNRAKGESSGWLGSPWHRQDDV